MSQYFGRLSVHSRTDGSDICSEIINESEEFQAIKRFQHQGDEAFHAKKYATAIQYYTDALDIDENNTSVLASRAAVYIEKENFLLAQQDAEKLLTTRPDNAKGHYLVGLALNSMGHHRLGMNSYLNALELDTDPKHADVLTNHITGLAQNFCYMPDNLIASLPDMDPYKKLGEVGSCLYSAGQHDLCIKVLNTAGKVATNQLGINMKVQLTLANAHSALKHRDIAIALYQECLSTAISTHDHMYQTKALVNIASLFLEFGDTHHAIVHYEKLIDLEKEIRGQDCDASLPAYWTLELQCALHLNLSIAYKTIGSLDHAVHFALQYTRLVNNFNMKKSIQAQSFHNEGLLYDVLGNYPEALKSYKSYLKESKAAGDKRGTGQAYGCLGLLYSTLNNYKLSATYHEQHIALVKKSDDQYIIAEAYEQFGDTLVKFEKYVEAVECYMVTIKSCSWQRPRMQTMALIKIGKAYSAQKLFQYGLYYFEQAKIIAEDYDFMEMRYLCNYNLACILQHSTQVFEIERAKLYFERLIPSIESKIRRYREEDTFRPKELLENLDECYKGIMLICSRYGYKDEALMYTEAMHRIEIAQYLPSSMANTWSLAKINRVVSEQNATVIYYSLLSQSLLIWVLQPVDGVIRFYVSKPRTSHAPSVIEELKALTDEWLKGWNTEELLYSCENRALPERDFAFKKIREANKLLASAGMATDQESVSLPSDSSDILMTLLAENAGDSNQKHKSIEQRLFDLILAPIEEVLSTLDAGSPLVIIPDRELYMLPFGCIQDWNKTELRRNFRIMLLPSMFLLDTVMQNEIRQMQKKDDIMFKRSQSRLGGVQKLISPEFAAPAFGIISQFPSVGSISSEVSDANARQTSNPYRTKARLSISLSPKTPIIYPAIIQDSLNCITSAKPQASMPTIPATNQLSATKSRGSPTRIEQLLGVHTMSTLTTQTSTNTDIIKTDCGLTEFSQVSELEHCLVIGSPSLPESVQLYGNEWKPLKELEKCQTECFKVAELLGVHAIVGEDATKDRFLKELESASIIHIASYACLREGHIVMTPNVYRHEKGAPLEHSYLVTSREITNLKLSAKLVVLSCGWSSPPRERKSCDITFLPSVFLFAGAQCVVSLLWSIPNTALQKFYFHFYQALQTGNFVSVAVVAASKHLQNDKRFSDMSYWAPFILQGKDVEVNLQHMRHSMLDQSIDKVEADLSTKLESPPLNALPVVPTLPVLSQKLNKVQCYMGELLVKHEKHKDVIPELILLLDGALKRQYLQENNQSTSRLPECLDNMEVALNLLKDLEFHFQGHGIDLSSPYIIYPHWNPDDLLVSVHDALMAVSVIASNSACARAIYEFFPSSQETLSYLIDVLCITKHAPEVQLKVRDLSVKLLWRNAKVKAVFLTLGFHQIGPLLNFNNTPTNWKLLRAGLQLFLAMSAFKNSILLHKLDVELLGFNSTSKDSFGLDQVKLPSLTPVILSRNQLRISTPWMTTVEKLEEMDEKMHLALDKENLQFELQQHLRNAKTWHQTSLSSQANEALDRFGRPKAHTKKVKVKAGATASCQRVPVDQETPIDNLESDDRRNYAKFVFEQRLKNISLRHQASIHKMFLPYVENTCTN